MNDANPTTATTTPTTTQDPGNGAAAGSLGQAGQGLSGPHGSNGPLEVGAGPCPDYPHQAPHQALIPPNIQGACPNIQGRGHQSPQVPGLSAEPQVLGTVVPSTFGVQMPRATCGTTPGEFIDKPGATLGNNMGSVNISYGPVRPPTPGNATATAMDLTVDHRGNPIGRIITFGGSGTGRPDASGFSPDKTTLKHNVNVLRDELSAVQNEANAALQSQQAMFERKGAEFETLALDVTQVQVAKAETSMQARYNSELQQANQAMQRTQERFDAQTQRAQATQAHLRQEVGFELQNHENQLRSQAQNALSEQKEKLSHEAQDILQQRQDALLTEAKQALSQVQHQEQVQQEQLQGVHASHQQQLGNMQLASQQEQAQAQALHAQLQLAEGDLMHNKNEVVRLNNLHQNMQQQLLAQNQHDSEQQNQHFKQMYEQLSDSESRAVFSQQQLHDTQVKHDASIQQIKNLQEQHLHAQQQAQEQVRASKQAQDEQTERAKRAEDQISEMQTMMDKLHTMLQARETSARTREASQGRPSASSPQEYRIGTPRTTPTPTVTHDNKGDEVHDYDDSDVESSQVSHDEGDEGDESQGRPSAKTDIGGAGRPDAKAKPKRCKEADVCNIGNIPQASNTRQVRAWRLKTKRTVASGSGQPHFAFPWIQRAETATSLQELEDDTGFETWTAKVATGFMQQIHGELFRQIEVLDEEQAQKGRMLNGPQLYWLILQDLKRESTETEINELEDLLSVELKGDNLRAFQTDWDRVLLHSRDRPQDKWLEYLYDLQIKRSTQFGQTYKLYRLEITQQGKAKSYERLYHMVQVHLEERKHQRNREDKGPGNGAHASEELKCRKGDCRQFFKTGKCFKGADCSYQHDQTLHPQGKGKGKGRGRSQSRDNRNKDNKHNGPGRPEAGNNNNNNDKQEEPRRGREREKDTKPSVARSQSKRRGASPSGKPDAKPCTWFARGTCRNGDKCNHWHTPICKFFLKGKCILSKECIYVHPTDDAAANANTPAPKAKPGATHGQGVLQAIAPVSPSNQ